MNDTDEVRYEATVDIEGTPEPPELFKALFTPNYPGVTWNGVGSYLFEPLEWRTCSFCSLPLVGNCCSFGHIFEFHQHALLDNLDTIDFGYDLRGVEFYV